MPPAREPPHLPEAPSNLAATPRCATESCLIHCKLQSISLIWLQECRKMPHDFAQLIAQLLITQMLRTFDRWCCCKTSIGACLLSLQAGVRFKQLDSQRFAISFAYNPEAIQDLKVTFDKQDREWHPDSKTWRFPLTTYREVQAWALKHFPAHEISPLEEVKIPCLHARNSVETDPIFSAFRCGQASRSVVLLLCYNCHVTIVDLPRTVDLQTCANILDFAENTHNMCGSSAEFPTQGDTAGAGGARQRCGGSHQQLSVEGDLASTLQVRACSKQTITALHASTRKTTLPINLLLGS